MLSNTDQVQPIETNSLEVRTSAVLFRLLSHELRNPLANIITSSSFYLDEVSKLSEDNKSSLVENIHSDATQLLTQIENIISLSRLTRTPIQMSVAELDAVVSKAVRRMRSKYPLRTFTITAAFDTLAFFMDAVLLEHAIMLLLKMMHEQLAAGISIKCHFGKKEDHVFLTLQALRSTMIFPSDSPISCPSDMEICQLIIQAHHGILHTASTTDMLTYEIELPLEETI